MINNEDKNNVIKRTKFFFLLNKLKEVRLQFTCSLK